MSESAKFTKLMKIAGLSDVGIEARDHGPFALVAVFGQVFAVCDNPQAFDKWELQRQFDDMEAVGTSLQLVTGREIFCRIITGNEYTIFHDGMAWAIAVSKYVDNGFMGLARHSKPHYRAIQTALELAGYQ